MKKLTKFISIVIALVLCCTTLPGCLVKYDKTKDFQQVVAKIESYDIVDPFATSAEIEEGTARVYKTEEYSLYKYQLANVISAYYQYILYGYYTVDSLLQELLTQRIVVNTAYAYENFDYIVWSQYEENEVTDYKMERVSSLLDTYMSEIAEERGEDYNKAKNEQEDENKDTTYPVYKDESRTGYEAMSEQQLIATLIEKGVYSSEEDAIDSSRYMLIKTINDANKSLAQYNGVSDDDIKAEVVAKCGVSTADADTMTRYQLIRKLDKYYYSAKQSRNYEVTLSMMPGVIGTDNDRSMQIQAMERVLSYIDKTIKGLENVDKDDMKKINDAWTEITEIRNTKGIAYTFEALGKSYIMEYLYGKSYREEVLVNLLQECIEASVGVTEKEITENYTNLLANQIASFANEKNYVSNAESGNLIVYHPQSRYFFVKHILIPFSSEQSAELQTYKTSAANKLNADYEDYRLSLANQIMSYAHIDGEDSGEALSVNDIIAEVKSAVAGVNDSQKVRVFTELMYKYSTDVGGFGQKYGYKEVIELADGESETYMQEFADAARALYDNGNGKIGDLSEIAVTDYGVHILMLTGVNKADRIVGLDEYSAYSDTLTVGEQIENLLYSAKLNVYFTRWRQQNINNSYNTAVKTFPDKYEKIMKDLGIEE